MKRTFCDICGEEITYRPNYNFEIKGEPPFCVSKDDDIDYDLCDDCRKDVVGYVIGLRSLRGKGVKNK